MMHPGVQAFYFGPPERRMFGAYHPSETPAHAAVLICPPLLHEHFRSYRFFSQVAGALAQAGLACLRFDYFGTGDSEGEDADFSPDGTAADTMLAAQALRRLSGDVPLILLGIRGSALFMHRDAKRVGASAVWLWQPVADGERYVAELEDRDRAERSSLYRYPLLKGEAPADAHDLMGFRVRPEFRRELSACSLAGVVFPVPAAVLGNAQGLAAPFDAQRHYALPESATAWASEVDLSSLIPLRDARPALDGLLADLPLWTAHG